MRLCLIPARGGSKRIPKKNIRPFCGKPMIVWSIEAALQSKCFDSIIVSTDSTEISVVAKEAGADVPFIRPAHLSDDFSTTHDVVLHAIHWFEKLSSRPLEICCLYPTAPMVSAEDLIASLQSLATTSPEHYVFSATSFSFPIERALHLDESGHSRLVYPQYLETRSQDLNQAYHDAGQFYWGRKEAWLTNHNVFDGGTAFVLPRWKALDIDTEEDWAHAEFLCQAIQLRL